MADLLPVLKQQFFDSNGDPLAGGKVYSYEAGTTTPKATYTSASGLVANANPVILDAAGKASIYINAENYKFVVTNSSDVVQDTVDNVTLPSVSSLASAFYRRQVNLTSASSPYTMDEDDNGTLFNVNSSGGAVVINAPEISSVDLPFNFAVILETAGNNCTINRAGTDTLAGATSKVIAAAGVGCQFVADNQTAPDKWSVVEFGTVTDGSITSAKLATSAITGHTEDTSPDSANDYILTYDASGTALKKARMVQAHNHTIQSKTTGYTAALTDGLAVCSGASFTITLPTAVGCSGKVLSYMHNGTNLSQVYTLDGNGTETIAGSLTYGLYTNGEFLQIISDGSNWLVLDHRTETGWTDGGLASALIGAVTSAPTKATTTLVDKVWWRRQGDSMQVRYEYKHTDATGSAAGTGVYLFGIPGSMTIDTAKVHASTSSTAFDSRTSVGFGLAVASGSFASVNAAVYDSSRMKLYGHDIGVYIEVSATQYPMNNAAAGYNLQVTVPISGWKP